MARLGFSLPQGLPNEETIRQALDEYRRCPTYWYVPKARVLTAENIRDCAKMLRLIFEEFLEEPWSQETQDAVFARLVEEGVHEPRVQGCHAARPAGAAANCESAARDAGTPLGRH